VDPGTFRRGLGAAARSCASCAGTPEKVEIDDSGVPSFGARVLVPFAQADRLRALHAGDRELALGWHHALAFEGDWTRDEADQDIGPGETVRLDEVSLSGPGTVSYDYELASLNLSAVNGMVFDNGVMLDVAIGLNATRLDLEAELGSERASIRAESIGPKLGFQLGWLSPWRLSLRGRFGYSAELPMDDDADQVETRTFELGLFVPLGPWAGLDAGWRWRDYDAESSDSDIELDLDGLSVSLAFGPY
jgi:hypothetical protein